MAREPITRKRRVIVEVVEFETTTTEIVVIDQNPLRHGAATECQEAMAELQKTRAAWNRFEREDKPSFARWRAREFGSLMSKARDVEAAIQEREALIHEVEAEMRRGFYSEQTAYRRIMFRRANPSATAEEEAAEPAHRSERAEGRRLSDFEKEALFQDWIRSSLGTNPDKMDDGVYTTRFEAFKSHMFGPRREEPLPQNSARRLPPPPVTKEEEPEPLPAADVRVKELYRRLVRRLHPDLRADGAANVSNLWHDVQEAYATGDVDRMEILLAISDIESNNLGEQTTLFQMRAVLKELHRAMRALQRSLRVARSEDAWNFARQGANDGLRSRVALALESALKLRKMRLARLSEVIEVWASPPRFDDGARERYSHVAA